MIAVFNMEPNKSAAANCLFFLGTRIMFCSEAFVGHLISQNDQSTSSSGLSSRKIFRVKPAVSTKNVFAGITIPQHPQLALNNFSSAHQDSYCTESVGLTGPTGKTLKLITQYHPYGLFGVLTCNSHGQMIGVGFSKAALSLVVFSPDCRVISVTTIGSKDELSFSGAYFYMDNNDNTIIIGGTNLICYPTANVPPQNDVYSLNPLWSSANLVSLITGSPDGNNLYSALPVWGQANLYWCVLAGDYNLLTGVQSSNAFVAVVEIVPTAKRSANNCTTRVLAKMELQNYWNNNSLAADENGLYAVFNKMDGPSTPASTGLLAKFTFDGTAISMEWRHDYDSCGYLLVGQTNIGSGTTPTITFDGTGKKYISITDNDAPQINVVVVEDGSPGKAGGTLVSKTPVFSKMRSGNEASLIGIKDRIIVESNYGHTIDYPYHQYVSNEPGMALINAIPTPQGGPGEIIWENPYTTYFGMSMLARESGIIFGFSGTWYESTVSDEGPMYSIVAMDSFTGRIIWRIPVGRGAPFCHEYGGIYFNRTNNGIYVGANNYIISIQEVDENDLTAP